MTHERFLQLVRAAFADGVSFGGHFPRERADDPEIAQLLAWLRDEYMREARDPMPEPPAWLAAYAERVAAFGTETAPIGGGPRADLPAPWGLEGWEL